MGVFKRFFAPSPFVQLHEHAQKVHKCVELMRPLTEALLTEDYEKIEGLHNEMSRLEHEADMIKNELRDSLRELWFLSVGQHDLTRFLSYQDDIADAAEDYAVVLLLRKTKLPEELKPDFRAFVDQVIKVSEMLIELESELSTLAEAAFTGQEAKDVLKGVGKLSEEEWKADRMERKFARHFYSMEDKLDPITVVFLDKYCKRLSEVANNAERTAKFLRLIVHKK